MKTLILIICLLTSSQGIAGKERGGADVVLMKDDNGQLVGAELFDFVEGKEVLGYNIPKRDNVPIKIQIEDALTKISRYFSKEDLENISKRIWEVYGRLQLSDKVPTVDDTFPLDQINTFNYGELFYLNPETLSFGKPMKFEQLAVYEKSTASLVRYIYVNHLKSTSRAGVIFHEGIYKHFREKHGAKDSVLARKWNAFAFSSLESNSERGF